MKKILGLQAPMEQHHFHHPETNESNDIPDDDDGCPFLIILETFAASFCRLEVIKFADTQRLSFVIQRRSSPMTRKDSLLLSKDDQVW